MHDLRYAFRLCVAREPTPAELSRLTRLLTDFRALCRAKPKDAARLTGRAKAGGDAAEVAAWVALARALLNLDEFVTRE